MWSTKCSLWTYWAFYALWSLSSCGACRTDIALWPHITLCADIASNTLRADFALRPLRTGRPCSARITLWTLCATARYPLWTLQSNGADVTLWTLCATARHPLWTLRSNGANVALRTLCSRNPSRAGNTLWSNAGNTLWSLRTYYSL